MILETKFCCQIGRKKRDLQKKEVKKVSIEFAVKEVCEEVRKD